MQSRQSVALNISRDFAVCMMTWQNRKLSETYLESMVDWDSAMSSGAQEVTLRTQSLHITTHERLRCMVTVGLKSTSVLPRNSEEVFS